MGDRGLQCFSLDPENLLVDRCAGKNADKRTEMMCWLPIKSKETKSEGGNELIRSPVWGFAFWRSLVFAERIKFHLNPAAIQFIKRSELLIAEPGSCL